MKRVMVVDDYEPNLHLYSAIVRRVIGEEPLAYDSPTEALRSLKQERPSLVVVDYQMPEMNGVNFIAALRQIEGHANTAVMMLTGVNDDAVQTAAFAAGATHYMEKPLALRDFTAHIRRYTSPDVLEAPSVDRPADDRTADTILRLHRAVRARDVALAERMRRTGTIAAAIARAMHLGAAEADLLQTASLVYDLGMLGVPENVLHSADTLPAPWRDLVREHARTGAAILGGGQSPLMQAAESIALSHHERYDGTGYPDALQSRTIPLYARIVAVADTYTALTSPRPYREKFSSERALAEIERASGSAFDPSAVDALIAVESVTLDESLRSDVTATT